MLLPVSTHVQWMGLLPTSDLKILEHAIQDKENTHKLKRRLTRTHLRI